MLTEKMEKAYNEQINAELYSAYLYYSMAAYFKDQNLDGFANWMNIQALEEVTHAQKFIDFVYERRGKVILEAIEKPKSEWNGPLDAFEDAFKHEQHVTQLINNLVQLATEEKDNASLNFLQWFVSEQVEEEATADGIVQQLKMVKDFGPGLFMMDKEMAGRSFTPPPAEA